MEEFRIGQLTKELVAAKLRAMDDPCEAAAVLVATTLTVAFRAIPTGSIHRQAAVAEACRGAMTGLILAEQSVARGAVRILSHVAELAIDEQMDPSGTLEAALRGIADIRRFLVPDRLEEMIAAVDAAFLGAGELFRKLLEAAKAEAADPL